MALMLELPSLRTGLSAVVLLLSTTLAAPLAAQDMDGDGVPDSRDVCPTTSMGLMVDGAGCDAFCEVVDDTNDVYLRSRLLEVGVAEAASFGSSGMPPAGWHARAPMGRLGSSPTPSAPTGWTSRATSSCPAPPKRASG